MQSSEHGASSRTRKARRYRTDACSRALTFILLTGCAGVQAAGEPHRTIAVGDLHADLPAATATLQMAGVIDTDGRWSAGHATFVQTGDVVDRGPDSKEVIELLQRLETQAHASGGQVVTLMGNHEQMNLLGDWRYVNAADVGDFGSVEARRAAFAPTGDIGRWLISRDVAARVDDTVYCHGGISAGFAAMGVDGLNTAAHEALTGRGTREILGQDGPLWYRGYLMQPEAAACTELETALAALGARRMVVGHTTQTDGRMTSRCDGRIIGIDTGISSAYGNHRAAIVIVGGDARAVYPDGEADLPDPH